LEGGDGRVLAGLEAVAGRFGEVLGPGQAERLSSYVEWLLEWNRAINVTGAESAEAVVEEHLPDSFALAQLVGEAPDLLDVGSGGGLPAIPFGILRPDVRLTLSEPRAKRRAFLTQVVHRLGLGARVVADRAESLEPGRFSAVVARAVYAPGDWLSVGGRLASPEGRVVVLLSSDADWRPPPGTRVVDEVRYSAGPRERLALACVVPRGTPPAGRST
jgi:16S rRNA (guanine(527)-N(7))-methyltransferase RsmG